MKPAYWYLPPVCMQQVVETLFSALSPDIMYCISVLEERKRCKNWLGENVASEAYPAPASPVQLYLVRELGTCSAGYPTALVFGLMLTGFGDSLLGSHLYN